MSKGRLDEARTILEKVLEDGSRLGEDRACAYSLENLGVVAYRQHDYSAALSYWETALRYPQGLRGRVAVAHSIANLADLRLRLGLVDHAEHAIAFGRKLVTVSASPARSAHFRIVAAQVALARRNTEAARREIEGALVDAMASGEGEYSGVASIVSARVALEDGDIGRALNAIEHAARACTTSRSRAEIAIVRALHLRALGQNALESANEALTLARAAGEEDLLAEIYALLATLHRDAGDIQAAQAHCCRAIAVRDQVASRA
jgi:tetratricopeptide (TPR) repeat protein